jgi:hypothetical protein
MIGKNQRCDRIVPDLAGVSVTMLWSLHNRASEAKRPDGILHDPESIYIQSAIDYDFARHFGDPLGSLAARAVEIDRALRSWLDRHPEGIVVSLGEGLETQSRRVDNGRMGGSDFLHRPTVSATSPRVRSTQFGWTRSAPRPTFSSSLRDCLCTLRQKESVNFSSALPIGFLAQYSFSTLSRAGFRI